MSKLIPPTDLQVSITPTAAADVAKALEAERGQGFYMVDPTKLETLQDFNVRIRSSDEWEEQVKALMDSIRENGFMADKPISVVADTDEDGTKHLWVIDGHTRLEAVYRLIANEGIEIESVPIVVKPKTTTFEDMLVQLVTSNSGKPLTPYETALVVKRLQSYGWDDGKIAKRLGYTEKYVGNLSVLAGAPAKIRNQVVAGKLSATEAVKLIRTHGAKATEVVEAATQAAANAGRGKVTAKDVKKVSAPKEPKTAGADKAPRAEKTPKDAAVLSEHKTAEGTDVVTAVSAEMALSAIDYALKVPADGLAWLRRWRAAEPDAVEELIAWTDPNGGL